MSSNQILPLLMLVSIQQCISFYPSVIGPRETAGLRSDRSAVTGWRGDLISSQFASSHVSRLPSLSHRTKQSKPLSSTVMMAGNIIDDIITRKKAEVEAMKANPPAAVSEWVQKMGTIKPKNAFLRAIKKPKGTTAIVTQIKVKTPAVERLCSVVDPAVLGVHHYEAGASAIAVCTDEIAYGFNYDTLRAIVKSQNAYRGNYPGPLPVMAFDFFLDPIQLALAASAGASAVCLNARILSAPGAAHGLADMLAAAAGLGLDAAVEAHDAGEVAAAVAAGAKIVGVSNRDPATWALHTPVDFVTRELVRPVNETVFGLVDSLPEGVVPMAMGGINETLVAWSLRDAGYSALMVGEAVMRGSETRMAGSAYQGAYNEAKGLIKAFKSKGSLKYGPSSTASFYGKGEGAKETLGMMSM